MEPRVPEDGAEVPRLRFDDLLTQLIDRAQEALRTRQRLRKLVAANQTIVGDLDLSTVLRRIVEVACDLVGAEYGALGVIAPDGEGLEEFVHVGMDETAVRRVGHLPQGKGLLGALIDDPYPVRLDHVDQDPRSVGFPEGHPQMESFLGVPVRVRDEVFGNLYLSNAASGHFDEDDEALVLSLAATAGVAIENARLFQQSSLRQDWLEASATVTRQVLSSGDGAAVQTIVETVRRLADAQVVALLRPGRDGDTVVVLAATGEGTESLVGRSFPVAGTLSREVLDSGAPVLVDDAAPSRVDGSFLAEVPTVGPVMLVPLVGPRGTGGVLLSGRRVGDHRFSEADLEMATTFATHASLAGELADARLDQERMALLEDRNRIAQDLHDHVIQQLFAAGMTLQGVSAGMDDRSARLVENVVDMLDDAVRQIRTSIFQLRPHTHDEASLRAAVLRAVAELVPALGFEPGVTFDGPVDAVSDDELVDDVLAVVREALTNTAKHARATKATVRVHAPPSGLEVEVSDDGVGPGGSRRSGIANLRNRAERRRGTLLLNEPPPERGTRLVWSVPFG
jgi:signal transduction histidine kinase